MRKKLGFFFSFLWSLVGAITKAAGSTGSKAAALAVVIPDILSKIIDGFVYRMDICRACREGCTEHF